MENRLLTSPRRRIYKAYSTAFKVAFSYLRLNTAKRFFGQSYYDKRIEALHYKNAAYVKGAIWELQGLFIKVGQLLSIMSNFLPEAFQEPLEALQDQIPPRPYAQVKVRIIQAFGKEPKELFASFSEEALASASIGQAHRATLKDGTEVVVKVQHFNIEAVAKVDLKIIQRLQSMISSWFGIKGMDYFYTQIKEMIETELDFRAEVKAMQVIAKNLSDEPMFRIPEVHTAFSTERVMTTSWCPGVKINQSKQLKKWNIDQEDLVKRLLGVYCRMVFKDGFYHADPHPGNILVQEDGTIVLLDFGAVATLQTAMREGISELIETAVKNDTQGMIEACRKMGFIAPGREAERMAEQMIEALRTFIQQEVKLEGLNFKDIEVDPFNNSLFDLIKNVGISGITSTVQVPKEFVLLNRMATLLLGICSTMAPKLNPLDVVKPYIQNFVLGSKGDMFSFVSRILRETATDILGLPGELQRVLRQTRRGNIDIASIDTRQGSQLVYHGIRQLTFSLLTLSTAFASYFLWQNNEFRPAQIIGGISLFFALALWKALRTAAKLRHAQK